jgi:hypothetical protein
MDTRKILLAKLSHGAIGEENAYLLGSLLVARISQAAMSRQDEDASKRVPFFLYMDEFQHFITPSISSILTGARKYGLGLVLSHQEIRQLKARSDEVFSAVLGNAYTRIVFRVGEQDAKTLADGFTHFSPTDLQNLGLGEAIVRLERPDFDFNLKTAVPAAVDPALAKERKANVLAASRRRRHVSKSTRPCRSSKLDSVSATIRTRGERRVEQVPASNRQRRRRKAPAWTGLAENLRNQPRRSGVGQAVAACGTSTYRKRSAS